MIESIVINGIFSQLLAHRTPYLPLMLSFSLGQKENKKHGGCDKKVMGEKKRKNDVERIFLKGS